METENEYRVRIENFIGLLSKQPLSTELDKTPDNKAFVLPIDFVETSLDELFFGQWQTHTFVWAREFNEVVASMILEVKHPVTGDWIKRVGAGAVVITQDKDASLDSFNSTKKKNALDLSFPKLKAECLKNAALSLGNIFGRNLNRKKKDVFNPIAKNAEAKKKQRAVLMIEQAKTPEDLNKLLTELPKEFHSLVKEKEAKI